MDLKKGFVAAVSLAMSVLGGCALANPDPVVIDYSTMPANFIKKVEYGQPYIIRRDGREFQFITKAEKGYHGKLYIKWGNNVFDEVALRPANQTPYLVYTGGKDFMIYFETFEDSKYAGRKFKGQMCYYRPWGETSIANSDNAMLTFAEEPTDPENVKVYIRRDILGSVYSIETYRVNENGHLKPKRERGQYVYPIPYFADKPLYSQNDAEVEVFPNENATEGTIERIPKGTKFMRLRGMNGYKDQYFTDLLMEDGRVARFHETYMFSEPEAIMAIRDQRGEWIDFYGVSRTGVVEDIPKEKLDRINNQSKE